MRAQQVFRASGENDHLVYCNSGMDQLPNGIAFGGRIDERFFGLWLRQDLESGRSDAPCSTFHSPMLSSRAAFGLDLIEVWAVEPDAPLEAEEGGGVLSDEHAEAARFVTMAGRSLHRDENGRAAKE